MAAQASEGLKSAERAVEEMKDAVQHDPGDLDLAPKLKHLKTRLEYVTKMLQSGDGGLADKVGGF